MIYQFPVPHVDELLGSVLARFVFRQGVRGDKVALELLFGSRKIVPSALLQGHLSRLTSNVQHLWPTSPSEMIANHSILPIFKPFVEPDRYSSICYELTHNEKRHSTMKVGISASSLVFPVYYRFCPVCFNEDINQHAYSYWRRQFQLPGVSVCLKHRCMLVDSIFELKPSRRHTFIDASSISTMAVRSAALVCRKPELLKLASNINQLLHQSYPYIPPTQWTSFYDVRLRDIGLKGSKGVDHQLVERLFTKYWGKCFLAECGLELAEGETWLKIFFRKQRRHFSYLHHLLCLQALFPSCLLDDAFKEASNIKVQSSRRVYTSSQSELRASEYQASWYRLRQKYTSLKAIRATREGARVYSWLYRFNNEWLNSNLPAPLKNNVGRVINWKKRDIDLVRKLIKVHRESREDLSLPRMTQSWFISKLRVRWGVDRHLSKLPLCKQFFIKYSETVAEYQIRRVLVIIVDCINKGEPFPQAYEIERAARLSAKNIREATRRIIREDLEMVPRFKLPSSKHRVS
ncbi:TnsD family Tn7-like transposition protein [Alteromonas hispanica]|uniref:Uncharacterized protein n=1 Tax=Alteromonas hispanica TaxID=315421 RepID=A0A6L9MSQ7_9ALTE|nr:TnsD family Tn7-like transposition protein [Alteromonas hispanica]NDW21198.1 hypothetical protein [Alteromonas hispanica]